VRRHAQSGAAAVAVAFAAAAGCGMPPVPVPKTSERYDFEAGRVAFGSERWLDAQTYLKRFLDLHPGHALADSAQYLLGRALYGSRSYAEAAVEFSILVREHPRSPLRDDASYEECRCYQAQMRPARLDPTFAFRARTCYNDFLLRYPDSEHQDAARERLQEIAERLAEKEYRNGQLFANMKRCDAAIIYFDALLHDFPTSQWVPRTLLHKGRCLQLLGRNDEAAAVYGRLVEAYPEHREAAEARAQMQRLQSPGLEPR
jgi:outer membrane protein assembly factor BamD